MVTDFPTEFYSFLVRHIMIQTKFLFCQYLSDFRRGQSSNRSKFEIFLLSFCAFSILFKPLKKIWIGFLVQFLFGIRME
jgi:hypothetical protein